MTAAPRRHTSDRGDDTRAASARRASRSLRAGDLAADAVSPPTTAAGELEPANPACAGRGRSQGDDAVNFAARAEGCRMACAAFMGVGLEGGNYALSAR